MTDHNNNKPQQNSQTRPQTFVQRLQQQDNILISMLQSDKIIDIAIFVCILGILILSLCIYIIEQTHLKFHLGVILVLMTGLAIALFVYRIMQCAEKNNQQHNKENMQKDIELKQNQQSEDTQISKHDKNQ